MGETPVIGITCSTLVLPGMRGVPRYGLAASYVQCVTEAGGLPLVLPNVGPELAASYLSRIDGVILSGGLDIDPHFYGAEPLPDLGMVDLVRDAFEIELAKAVKAAGVPVLAICRGIQILNVAFGGTLIQHIPGQVKGALKHQQDAIQQDAMSHSLDIEAGTRLHDIAGATRTRVNSFHHQSVERVAEGFDVSARTHDGVIEGIEDRNHPFCVGVQWHPERRSEDPFTRGLFAGLVEAARAASRAGTGS